MAVRIMETDEEYLDRTDGTPEGNFARAGGYNRMANVAVADYNSRPMPEDWDGALRHQEEQQRVRMEQERNAALAQQISANRGVYDGYAQMGNTVAARQAQFVGNANAHLASSLRLAAENGGRLPQYAWQGLGGALGLDGKDTAIVGGGFDKKGGFMLAVARKNPQTGQVEQTLMSFTPQQQYSLMLSTPGIFSRQEVEGMRGQLIDNFHMHPDQVPQVPQGWGETGNVGVGNRTATGGTSVNPNWLYGPQRRSSISAFGADGRGGFTQYESNEQTGYQLQQRDSGTRADDDKGRWKVLSRGADTNSDDGTQITRYENDKTGEVVSVRDGETPPWESRAVGEKERIARINADGKIKAAEKANETKMNLAEAANALKQYGIDVSAQLKERGLDIQQQNADERSAHNQAVESQQAENEKGRSSRARMANETKTKMAEMKSRGTIGGRPPTTHEYVEALRFANDLLNDEADRNAMREHAKRIEESLRQRGEKIPEPPPSGKTEVKQGDNGAREIRKDRNGVEWEIVRDENGKPIGKRRVTR